MRPRCAKLLGIVPSYIILGSCISAGPSKSENLMTCGGTLLWAMASTANAYLYLHM
ncbi:hypothetical protein F4808DRAFT_440095 [Astrocystis sublimbata]|nr:hypothetical protein F4808DRAFT_440095 [Astrocystis sublimbata]